VTESTLAAIEKLHAAWEGNVPLSATAIPDLIAEIRRLWKVRDAAERLGEFLHIGPLEDVHAALDPDIPSDVGWAYGITEAISTLEQALAAAKEAE
jgi:hypothetical protein